MLIRVHRREDSRSACKPKKKPNPKWADIDETQALPTWMYIGGSLEDFEAFCYNDTPMKYKKVRVKNVKPVDVTIGVLDPQFVGA